MKTIETNFEQCHPTPRAELVYDGCGINGPDEYRSRVATFANDASAKAYGPVMAASTELLAALQAIDQAYDQTSRHPIASTLLSAIYASRRLLAHNGWTNPQGTT